MAVSVLFQDQLSADMYSFVAKEIDYANYFQTVSVFGILFIFFISFIKNTYYTFFTVDSLI